MTLRSHNATTSEIESFSQVYALLARLWLQEVDVSLLDRWQDENFAEAFTAAGGIVAFTDQVDELATDYCQLFVGPKNHLAPYQSVWETGELQSEIASSVQRFADLLHYQQRSDCPHTMIDHLGTQFDIMAQSTSGTVRSACGQVADEIAAEFFARHLTWPERLLVAASARASSPFYRAMIEMTADFLSSQRSVWLG